MATFLASTIGLALFNAGASLAVVNFFAIGLGATLISAGVRIGAAFLLSKIAQKLHKTPPSEQQNEIRQAIPVRTFNYGSLRTSGALLFEEVRDSIEMGGYTLFKVIAISCRRIEGYDAYYFNGREVEQTSGSVTTAPYDGAYALLSSLNGTTAQTADMFLTTAFDEWTSEHRLRGVAYIVVGFLQPPDQADFQTVYPNGPPQVAALHAGACVYDPRLDSTQTDGSGSHRIANPNTWEASDNAGLCVLDWLIFEDGYAFVEDRIDVASFMAFADICDDARDLLAGGTEARFRVATQVSLAEPRKAVLARLLEACDAELYTTAQGKTGIRGGVWEEPTVTIDHDLGHILEFSFVPPDALARFNELAIQYYEPDLAAEAEPDPWRNQDDIDDFGLKSEPFDLSQIPSLRQARHEAKKRMARGNPDWTVELRCILPGLQAIGERVVTLKLPELGIDGPFWVDGVEIAADFATVNLRLSSADPAAYDWDPEEEGEPVPIPPNLSPDLGDAIEPPADLALTQEAGPIIDATWTPSATPGAYYKAQYRPATGGFWKNMTVDGDDHAFTGTVAAGDYTVRVRMRLGFTEHSAWATDTITVT